MRTLAALFLLASPLATRAIAQRHVVTPADIVDLKSLAGPRVSPDGRLAAYTVRTPMPSGKPANEHIWLARTDRPGSAHPFVYGNGTDGSPAWSPDGHHLAFLSNRSNPLALGNSPYRFESVVAKLPDPAKPEAPHKQSEKPTQPPPPETPDTSPPDTENLQLWWIPLEGGEAEPLTNLRGGVRSFAWSRDGSRIAFLRTDPPSPAEHTRTEAKNDRRIADSEYHYTHLWIYDVAAHQATQLTRDHQNIDTIDWSPDGSSLVARVSPTPRIDDYWRVSRVLIYDSHTGAVRQVVEPHSGYQQPRFSRDGSRIAFSRFTPRSITDMHLVRTLASGLEVRLEDKLKGTIGDVSWLDGNRMLVSSYVGAHTQAALVDAATLAETPLPGLPATTADFDATPDGDTIVFLGETPRQPAELSVLRTGAVQVITETNPQVRTWALGEQREVSWTNPTDHATVYGVLTLPPGYQAGTRYKTAIHMHGGPEEAFTVGFSGNWYNYGALLASQGYVVLQPNYRGSAGQSIAFTEGNYKDWGGADFADVMAGADWVVAQGFADPDRMVLGGWSFGGFLTAWAVTHTGRFKAAMAGAPVTDVLSMATTTDIAPSYVTSYLGPLDAAAYDTHSAIRSAAACTTPVLFLHGEADVRVPTSQSEELYHALRYTGHETQLVTYPREPHIFSEREHQIDSLTRELQWFADHLGSGK